MLLHPQSSCTILNFGQSSPHSTRRSTHFNEECSGKQSTPDGLSIRQNERAEMEQSDQKKETKLACTYDENGQRNPS